MIAERNIYLIEPTEAGGEDITHDCNTGFVVIATSAREARRLAAQPFGDEPRDTWTDPRLSKCSKLGYAANNSKSRIALRSFHAG